MEAETIITLLLGAAGSILAVLCTVIAYLYRQQQQQHEREIKRYEDRLQRRDTRISELEATIREMDEKTEQTYQRILEKLNGRNKTEISPKP